MSSLIVSHDLHLMMLEIAVENLYVPWTSEFDKVIMKKTIVMFRMLDEEWTPLSPNRRDRRPYRGSNCENENFYGGRSIVFCVPMSFFEEEASGVDIQLYIWKELCKYFEMDPCQIVGFVAVPVNDLLNSIAKQIRERNELEEYLSDYYKGQIISRSMKGTYTLLDENFQNTSATISLYIRISYLGKCIITEVTCIESIRKSFHDDYENHENHKDRENDEKVDEFQPYLSEHAKLKELRSRRQDYTGLLDVLREKFIEKEATDLAMTRGPAAAATAIADATQDTDAIVRTTPDAVVIADSAAISSVEIAENAAALKKKEAMTDHEVFERMYTDAGAAIDIPAREEITTTLMAIGDEVINDYQDAARTKGPIDSAVRERTYTDAGAVIDMPAREEITTTLMAIGDEVINGYQGVARTKDVKANAVPRAKAKGHTIKDNGGTVFRKAFSTSSKSKRGRNTATIGITGRGKRISPLPPPPFLCLQTYLLCCRLQPRPTCFTHCFDVSPCYCHWTACPLQFCHRS
ncbi:uncharacterized protein [Linepithema humile]|uniref:uncharacterized protein isoform X2 n=1 Tax=Linepithema humile TaxID=83485 RepID=UPI00351EF221